MKKTGKISEIQLQECVILKGKKEMKKLLCVLLSLTMIFALAACGGDDKAVDKPADAVETPAEDAADQTPAPETEAPETDAKDTKTEEEDLKPVSLGVVEGNTYKSEYLGLSCTIPEGFKLLSVEELQEVGEMVDEILDEETIKDVPTIQDMYAINTTTGANVNIVLTQLSDIDRATMKRMTEEQIIDSTLSNKDNLIATYKQAGMEVSGMDKDVMQFMGEEHHVLKTDYTVNGAEAIIIQLFNFNVGGQYGATITFTANTMDEIAELTNMFQALS